MSEPTDQYRGPVATLGANPVDVVRTQTEADRLDVPPLLVIEALEAHFDSRGLGSGPISCSRIGDGQSNVTFLIRRGHATFVVRRGPRPPFPKSAHDMVREARIQQLLREAGAAVPEIYDICEDDSVLGTPFYTMSYIDGVVITGSIPPHLNDHAERRRTAEAAVDALISLHAIDASSGPLFSVGRPSGYLQRQLTLFNSLWASYSLREIPAVNCIGSWLAANVPDSQATTVVHGDFRLGNLMFARHAPARVQAILDWEMATLGDPLADLGYLTATYADPDGYPTVLELTPITRQSGYLHRGELVDRYRAASPLDVQSLPWYQALALWKAAIFSEAIYTRWLKGERPGDRSFAPTLECGVPRLLEGARRFAGLTGFDAFERSESPRDTEA